MQFRTGICNKVPPSISFETAAATMQQGMTAHYLTARYLCSETRRHRAGARRCGRHRPAARADRQNARRARVRHVSTPGKVQLASQAVDAVINYVDQDFAAEIRRTTDGAGVNVVYDSVGQTTFEKSLHRACPAGQLVIFGRSSGPVPPFDTAILNAKGSLSPTSEPDTQRGRARCCGVARGRSVEVDRGRKNSRSRLARSLLWPMRCRPHRTLENRQSAGKIGLIP